jgi:predicted  nucleic acid-binding Zn-ribbon protein
MKSVLIDKLDAKQTFTFGGARSSYESDGQSSFNLKDEIDKLHFIIEEKDYMNSELKQEITILRQKIARLRRQSHSELNTGDLQHEIETLKSENRRLQEDLNKTEDNYNEQCLLYKHKLNDERQRTVEVREEMTELRNKYDKKLNALMQQL